VDDRFLGILEKALEQPHGYGVLCPSPEAADKVRRLLYLRRAKAREGGDARFDCLSISFSPHSGEILYVHRKDSDESEKRPPPEENDSPVL